MQPHDQTGLCLDLPDVCEMVANAGFHGLAIDLGAGDVEQAHAVRPHMVRCGLTPLIVAFPKSIGELDDTLRMAKDFGAPFVDVIGQVMPVTIEGMVPIIRQWITMAENVGIPVHFETHRNCITNDLYATLTLLDAVPEMQLSADLSHFVVDREMRHPVSRRDRSHISRVLERSQSFQGRVASRQQIQLQLDFPQHAKWVDLFQQWWREGLASWRLRNASGDCVFLCELGPPEYAMTDARGMEMSDRWQESLVIKRWIEQIWADLETADRTGQPAK